MPARFSFTPVVPPFAGAGQEVGVVASYMARLKEMGGELREVSGHGDPAPLVYLIATGGTERAVLDLHEARRAAVPEEPVVLLAHPGNNSLPAALEVLARLQQDGTRGRIVYIRGLDDKTGWASFAEALADVRVRAQMRSARIGLVGAASDWLVASSPDPDVVSAVWGPEVVDIGIDDLDAAIDAVTDAEAVAGADALKGGASACMEPSGDDLLDVARVHAGLRALVEQHSLDAVTVRCFDLVLTRSTSGCFALSELLDAGVIAGCEGDLVSTVGMLWARELTGQTPWMANPADVDLESDTVLLAHCTVPRSIVGSYRLRSHFESGLGVGIEGELPLGPVTLLRIGGSMMDELWLAEGEITGTSAAADLCRTQARVALTRGRVRELLSAPLGNHIVMVYGHHAARLAQWWETML